MAFMLKFSRFTLMRRGRFIPQHFWVASNGIAFVIDFDVLPVDGDPFIVKEEGFHPLTVSEKTGIDKNFSVTVGFCYILSTISRRAHPVIKGKGCDRFT